MCGLSLIIFLVGWLCWAITGGKIELASVFATGVVESANKASKWFAGTFLLIIFLLEFPKIISCISNTLKASRLEGALKVYASSGTISSKEIKKAHESSRSLKHSLLISSGMMVAAVLCIIFAAIAFNSNVSVTGKGNGAAFAAMIMYVGATLCAYPIRSNIRRICRLTEEEVGDDENRMRE